MEVVTVLIFILVLALLGYLFMNRTTMEGFDGNVPEPNQTSAIARDTASATTTNPQLALAQPKDIQALMEVIKNFKLLYNAQDPMTLNLDKQSLEQTQYLSMQADNLINRLQAALGNSDAVSMTVDDTSQIRKAYDCSIAVLRGKSEVIPSAAIEGFANVMKKGKPKHVAPKHAAPKHTAPKHAMPNHAMTKHAALKHTAPKHAAQKHIMHNVKAQGAAPNGLTIDILINLQMRVQAESLRLSNLRSSAATVTKRISDLDRLSADLGGIISSINRGQTKLSSINITPAAAERFLKSLGKNTSAGTLNLSNKGAAKAKAKAKTAGFPSGLPTIAALQPLVEASRGMKWSMSIGLESDPAHKQNQDILDKIAEIERTVNQYMISDTPMPKGIQSLYEKELNVLKNITESSKVDVTEMVIGPSTPILQNHQDSIDVHKPAQHNLDSAQGMNMGVSAGTASDGIGVGDYNLSDSNIQHRASAASFDDSMVGGLDYKKRVQEMCRQIQAANLGDPANFGCIKNPNEVSASYSWKGNYQMVCSRLGDTWGNWYPQMFGCPKVDPTAKFTRKT
jgi:hypothetical protein